MRKVLIGLLLFSANILAAQTYTVNTTADSGPGSLRDAITEANAGNYDRIVFDVSPGSTATDTIFVNSDLPTITVTLEIDGSTESGFSTFNKPRIILKGNDPSCNFGVSYGVDSLSVLKNIGIYNFQNAVIAGQKKWTADGLYIGNTTFSYMSVFTNSDSCKITNCVMGYGGDGSIAGSANSGVYLGGKGTIFGGVGQENIIANVKSNAIIQLNYKGTCYENIFRNAIPTIGPAQIIYEGTGVASPSFTSVVTATTATLTGVNQPGDTIYALVSSAEGSFGPTNYKAIADVTGNWNISMPIPVGQNLSVYMGRRDVTGANAKIDTRYSFGPYYDTIWVTNTDGSSIYTYGSLPWAVNKAVNSQGNKIILFVPSIDLTTPILYTTWVNTTGAPNNSNVIVDGKGVVKVQLQNTPFQFNSTVGGTVELKGMWFDFMNSSNFLFWAFSKVTVDACYLYNGTGLCIRSISNASGVTVKNSKFWDVYQATNFTSSQRDTITDCEFGIRYLPYAGGYDGIYQAVTLKSAQYSVVTDNKFFHIGIFSFPITQFSGHAIKTEEGTDYYTIHNNTIDEVFGVGMYLGAQHASSTGQLYHNCVVSNNTFSGQLFNAIYIIGTDNLLVKNNTILCQDSTAIRAYQSRRIKLSGNTFATQKPGFVCYGDYPDFTNGPLPPNDNKTAPVIIAFASSVLSGTSQAGDSIEVFLADVSVPSGAVKFLGKTKAVGGTWSIVIPAQWQGGSYVAIATDGNGNSSALSDVYLAPGQKNIYTVRTAANTGCYCMREAIDAVNNGTANQINFNISPDKLTTDTIRVPSRYLSINNSVVIDATSETGYDPSTGPVVYFKFDSIAAQYPDCYSIVPTAFTAFDINAGNSTIKGIGIDGFGKAVNFRDGYSGNILRQSHIIKTQARNTIDIYSDNTIVDSCKFASNFFDNASYGCTFDVEYDQNLIYINASNVSVLDNYYSANWPQNYFRVEQSDNVSIQRNDIRIDSIRLAGFMGSSPEVWHTESSNNVNFNNNIVIVTPSTAWAGPIYLVIGGVINSSLINARGNDITALQYSRGFIFNNVNKGTISHNTIKIHPYSDFAVRLDCGKGIAVDSNLLQGGQHGIEIRSFIFGAPTIDSIKIRDNHFVNTRPIQFSVGAADRVEMRRNTSSVLKTSVPIQMDPSINNNNILPPTYTGNLQSDKITLSGTVNSGEEVEVFKVTETSGFYTVDKYLGVAIADASGNWSYDVTSPDVNPLAINQYSATVTGVNKNTSAHSFPQSFQIDLCSNPNFDLLGQDQVSCPNDTITLTVGSVLPGYTVAWTGPNSLASSTSSIKAKEKGKYIVQVTNTSACTVKDSINVDYKLGSSIPDFLIADQAGPGETLIAVEITYPLVDSSSWNFYGSPYQKVGSYYQVTYANTGTYQVTMRAHLDACYEDVTKTVHIDPAYAHQNQTVSPGANDFSSVIVKPNPTDGRFDLEILLNSEKDVTVEWLNAGNQSIERTWNYTGENHYEEYIDLAPLANGVYLLRVYTSDDVRIVKVVVQ